MPVSKRLSLVELLTVVGLMTTLAALALPAAYGMQLRAKRAELVPNVDSLITAQIAYAAANDRWVDLVGWVPASAPGRHAAAWSAPASWGALGWRPDGEVWGRYAFKARCPVTGLGSWPNAVATPCTDAHLCASGITDLDLDGTPACGDARIHPPFVMTTPKLYDTNQY